MDLIQQGLYDELGYVVNVERPGKVNTRLGQPVEATDPRVEGLSALVQAHYQPLVLGPVVALLIGEIGNRACDESQQADEKQRFAIVSARYLQAVSDEHYERDREKANKPERDPEKLRSEPIWTVVGSDPRGRTVRGEHGIAQANASAAAKLPSVGDYLSLSPNRERLRACSTNCRYFY